MPKQATSSERHSYTYLGPAKTFRAEVGGQPISIGDTVTLTDAQVRSLIRAQHQFAAAGQAGEAAIEQAREAARVERQRLELEARANKQANQ